MDADLTAYVHAVVLGVVQALTEFLPISSSGHLVLAPHLLGDDVSSLTFDVGLHLGTMLAVIVYFWRDWLGIAAAVLRDASAEGVDVRRWRSESRLGLWIVVGTVPAVIVGFLFEDWIDVHAREPEVIGVTLILFGVLLGLADRWGSQVGRLGDMTAGRAAAIGCAQAIALIPGVSRSGATITAGRGLGFDRDSAARFSFLLSAPVVFGAGVLKFAQALSGDEVILWGPLLVGAATAALVGALVISVFLRFIRTRTLSIFVWYRIALGVGVLVAAALGAF